MIVCEPLVQFSRAVTRWAPTSVGAEVVNNSPMEFFLARCTRYVNVVHPLVRNTVFAVNRSEWSG